MNGGCIFPADDTNTPDPALADTNPCTDLRCVSGTSQNVNDDTNIPDDGTPCTDDYCVAGVDYHPPSVGTCLINGVDCYQAYEKNPSDGCQICYPDESQTDWSAYLFREGFEEGDLGLVSTNTLDGPISWHATDYGKDSDYSAWFGMNPSMHTTAAGACTGIGSPTDAVGSRCDPLDAIRSAPDDRNVYIGSLFDVLRLYIVLGPNGGAQKIELWDSTTQLGGTTEGEWLTIYLDVSVYSGKEVQFLFDFDSGDDLFNSWSGAYVDNIRVETGCCASDADCDDGNACTVGSCVSGSCSYEDTCEQACIRTTPNLAFVLDRTVSMSFPRNQKATIPKWEEVKVALEVATSGYYSSVNMGLKTFPTDVGYSIGCTVTEGMDVPFRSSGGDLSAALATLEPDGFGNSVAAGLYATLAEFQNLPYDGPNYAVVITDDGESCEDDAYVQDAVELLASEGITTVFIGYGPDVYHEQLNSLALLGGMRTRLSFRATSLTTMQPEARRS